MGKKSDKKQKAAGKVIKKAVPADLLEKPNYRLALLVVATLTAYGIGLMLRLLELSSWNYKGLWVGGQPLLVMNDVYYYIAAAQGTSFETAYLEFVKLTRLLHSLTHMTYTRLAFWLPAVLAPLIVLPLALQAWRENLEEAILPAGVIAACTGIFLMRTRLGCYDHDMISLFLPVCYAVGLLIWLSKHATTGWRFQESLSSQTASLKDAFFYFAWCLPIGGIGWLYLAFYPQGLYLTIPIWGTAMILALFLTDGQKLRAMICLGLLPAMVVSLKPFWGLCLTIFLAVSFSRGKKWLSNPRFFWPLAAILFGIVIFVADIGAKWSWMIAKLSHQDNLASMAAIGNLWLPTFLQSVREAQPVEWHKIGRYIAGHNWIFLSGIAGYVYVTIKRPLFLIFLPFLVAGLSCIKLGERFAMYGGVVVALGVGFGAAILLQKFGIRKSLRAGLLGLLSLLFLYLFGATMLRLEVRRIVPSTYVQAMMDLKSLSKPDARVWSWWDLGFATQYYAGRASLADGHRQLDTFLFPLGVVHMTTSPLQAAQVMKLVTKNQEAYSASAEEYKNIKGLWATYLRDPLGELPKMEKNDAQAFLDELAKKPLQWPENLREQYLVFTWDMLRSSFFINHFGTWNLISNQPNRLKGLLEFTANDPMDKAKGLITVKGQTLPMDLFREMSTGETRFMSWPNNSGIYGILNKDTGSGYLVDKRLYQSMMVQMLIAEPKLFEPYFELVIDRAPDTRVYRLK